MKILVLNAGSSSQKSCLYEFKAEELPIPSRPLWEADIDWSHRRGMAELKVTTADHVVEPPFMKVQEKDPKMVEGFTPDHVGAVAKQVLNRCQGKGRLNG